MAPAASGAAEIVRHPAAATITTASTPASAMVLAGAADAGASSSSLVAGPTDSWTDVAPSSDSLQRAQNSQVGRLSAPHLGQRTAFVAFIP
jgi:hypothetical protein